jgi:hypothetical protein
MFSFQFLIAIVTHALGSRGQRLCVALFDFAELHLRC